MDVFIVDMLVEYICLYYTAIVACCVQEAEVEVSCVIFSITLFHASSSNCN